MSNPDRTVRFPVGGLFDLATKCLESAGARSDDARIVAEVLLAADLRGIASHGVARLRRYVDDLRNGAVDPQASLDEVASGLSFALLDANNGLGPPAAAAAMRMAVELARRCGVAAVAVRRTNHFGIAGYYAMLAAEQGMGGIVTTNASPQVAPTFAAEPMYGTNPIAFALPTPGAPFVLDMATSTVPRGKLEHFERSGAAIPEGWAIDPVGNPTTRVGELVDGLKRRAGFSLLPLGGAGETFGGHKGFGLGLWVDLMCGPLAGAGWGRHVYGPDGANLGQWFLAIDVAAFRPIEEFRAESERMLDEIRRAKRLPDATRIYVHGEKEAEESSRREREGIPLLAPVVADLKRLAEEAELTFEVEPLCA